MATNVGSMPDVFRIAEPERQAALKCRLKRMDEILEEPAGKLASGPLAEEMERLCDEVQALQDAEPLPHPGHPGPGRTGSTTAAGGKRWKAGHWSEPVIRAVQGKALLSGSVTVPSLTGGIVPLAPGDRATSLLDVIPSVVLRNTDTFSYLKETARTHNAAEVAAAALKPTSVYTVQKVDDTVKVIAHLSQPINRFDLEDTGLLRQYIEGSLVAGVKLRLDTQILSGSGAGVNLRGLANTAGIQTQVFATSVIQTARKALTKLQTGAETGYVPSQCVYVVSPAIWETVELSQESDGSYLMHSADGPVDLARQRLWGQPVIVSNAITGANPNCYLFDPSSTMLWERDTVGVDWSEAPVGSVAGEAGFKTNEIMFRAEGRYGFGVLRPAGVVQFATV